MNLKNSINLKCSCENLTNFLSMFIYVSAVYKDFFSQRNATCFLNFFPKYPFMLYSKRVCPDWISHPVVVERVEIVQLIEFLLRDVFAFVGTPQLFKKESYERCVSPKLQTLNVVSFSPNISRFWPIEFYGPSWKRVISEILKAKYWKEFIFLSVINVRNSTFHKIILFYVWLTLIILGWYDRCHGKWVWQFAFIAFDVLRWIDESC